MKLFLNPFFKKLSLSQKAFFSAHSYKTKNKKESAAPKIKNQKV